MTEEGRDLLDEAVSMLRETLASQLSGESRYLALLTANAVATAHREATMGNAIEASQADSAPLAKAIRDGSHDGDDELYQRLLANSARRAWVTDPNALTEDERSSFVGGEET